VRVCVQEEPLAVLDVLDVCDKSLGMCASTDRQQDNE
jgi:hypothetical protein